MPTCPQKPKRRNALVPTASTRLLIKTVVEQYNMEQGGAGRARDAPVWSRHDGPCPCPVLQLASRMMRWSSAACLQRWER